MCFGGSNQTTTQTQTQQFAIPEMQKLAQLYAQGVQGLSGEMMDPNNPNYGFKDYGHGVAAETPDEIAARDRIRAQQGQTGNALNAIAGNLAGQGTAYAQGPQRAYENVNAYMNPYMSAVTDEINRQADINANNIRGRAAAAKAFGGSRQAVMEGMNRESADRNVALSRARAFETSLQAAQGDEQLAQRNRMFNADQINNMSLARARALAQLAQGAQQSNLTDAAALNGMGNQQRAVIQQLLAQQQAKAAQADPYQQRLQQLALLRSGFAGGPMTGTTTTTQPGASLFGQLIGGGAAIAGLGGQNGFGWWGRGGTGVPGFRG